MMLDAQTYILVLIALIKAGIFHEFLAFYNNPDCAITNALLIPAIHRNAIRIMWFQKQFTRISEAYDRVIQTPGIIDKLAISTDLIEMMSVTIKTQTARSVSRV